MQRLFTLTAANCLPSAACFSFSFLTTARSVATTMLSRSHTNSHWACNCCALALACTYIRTHARILRFESSALFALVSFDCCSQTTTATATAIFISHSLLKTEKRTVLVQSWFCTECKYLAMSGVCRCRCLLALLLRLLFLCFFFDSLLSCHTFV